MQKEHLDIIIPCYNPQDNWSTDFITSCHALCSLLPNVIITFILVNDGSTKNVSQGIIQSIKSKVVHFKYLELEQNRGKGAALRKGFAVSESKYALFTDIDFPYQIENMVAMYQKLLQGADIIVGTRSKAYYTKVPKFRVAISKLFKNITKIIFRIPTTETQAGLKAFSEKGKNIIAQTNIDTYLFDLELIKKANKQGLTFDYVALELKENVVLSKMSMRVLAKELFNFIKIFFS